MKRDLVISQTTLQQQELQLKNVLSRSGVPDPLLAEVRVVPTDRIVVPDKDELPPWRELVEQALANRSDLTAEKMRVTAAEVSALGTKNGILLRCRWSAGGVRWVWVERRGPGAR